MKINKNIFKLLGLSLFMSNFSLYPSIASDDYEIPNRYQTLEGEYITIEDSTDGELVEIEVFGNTIQDENNLENIQSVGDLYVDDNGNPILDSQGREQYKVDIISSDYTHIKNDFSNIRGDVNNTFIDALNRSVTLSKNRTAWLNSWFEIVLDEPVKIGDVINFSFYTDKPVNVLVGGFKSYAWYDNVSYSGVNQFTYNKIASNEFDTIRIQIDFPMDEEVVFTQLNKNYNKTTILLPTQLQKVGDVADRLYWDNEKGRYIIEKNIKEYITPDVEYTGQLNIDAKFPEDMVISDNIRDNYPFIFSGAKVKGWALGDSDKFAVKRYRKDSYIRLATSSIYTNEEISSKLSDKKVYYITENPEIIETNIISKLKIPTYEGKTHISADSKNGVNPTLKVIVDRLHQVAKSAVEEAEVNSIMDNISLARIYVNMLPESLYKDQLQEQLSNVFSSDITLDRKTATANVDVYIKSENMLSMTLSTNNIIFEDYSGVSDLEQTNAIEISINSSLPYQLNSYLESEIKNADGSNKIDIDRLNIKDSEDTNYKEFNAINDKLVLKDNCISGNNLFHYIDVKLKGGDAYPSDIYKTVIKFEAEQK